MRRDAAGGAGYLPNSFGNLTRHIDIVCSVTGAFSHKISELLPPNPFQLFPRLISYIYIVCNNHHGILNVPSHFMPVTALILVLISKKNREVYLRKNEVQK